MDKTIVIAEDNKELNTLIRIRLEKTGYEVISCYDGASALEKINEIRPDLVVLDIDLPDIYGFELLGKIRQNPGLEKTKVLVLTGVTSQMGGETSDAKWKDITGVNVFLSKPHDTNNFLEKVNELLQDE